MGADRTQPRQRDVAAVGFDPDNTGGESHCFGCAGGLEPREAHGRTSALAAARRRPGVQGAGQAVQAGVVGLLRVLRPPGRAVDLALVPSLAQRRQRPPQHRGQLILGDAVAAFGGPLIHHRLHQRQHVVVREPRRTSMRRQRPQLLRCGIERKSVCLRRPTLRTSMLSSRNSLSLLGRRHRSHRSVPRPIAAVQARSLEVSTSTMSRTRSSVVSP